MKLSIVVPIYNVEKYLSTLLDSLVNQTYSDKEIILVNDGSKDGSGKICDEYAAKFPFVKALHIENSGVVSARNTGLAHATGEYIVLADSDDAVDLDCYEILVDALENTKSDIACCGFANEYSENMHMKTNHKVIPEPYVIDGRENCLLSISNHEHSSLGFIWNKVFRKKMMMGGYNSERILQLSTISSLHMRS